MEAGRVALEKSVLDALASVSAEMQWGKDDCALWCANIVRPVLGYDPAAWFRGRYVSRFGAARYIAANGGMQGLLQGVARRHGWEAVDPQLAQPGDIGLAWTATGLATVICRTRGGWFVGRNEFGFTAVPARDVAMAWSVLPDALFSSGGYRIGGNLGGPYRPGGAVQINYDPISATVAALALIGVEVSTTTAAFILSTVLAVAFSVASSLLQPHLGGSVDNSLSSPEAQSVQVTERQSIPYKIVILGGAFVGGALFFEQVKPPYLYQGILNNYGEISGVDNIWIGTNKLVFSSIVPNTIMAPIPTAGQADYPNHLQVSLRYGKTDQTTDPIIAADFPNLSTNLVDPSTGTKIGNMTGNGGLAGAFNGQTDVATASASLTGTGNLAGNVGKNWGSAKTVVRYRAYAPTDASFSTSATTTVTFALKGSTDNFATSNVTLHSVSALTYPTGGMVDVAAGIDVSTAYQYHRIEVTETSGDAGSHVIYIAEAQFFFGALDGTDFSQRGIATAVLRYHYGGTDNSAATQAAFIALWGQVARPNAYFYIRGVKVYDPRDPTQSLTDETTWKWSNNASLVQAYYLTRSWGGRIPKSVIDWTKVADSANYDDDVIACKDGTFIKRHTIDGALTLNQKPSDALPRLLTANRGLVLESGGHVWVQSSRPLTPIATIYDGLLTGSFKYQASKAKSEFVNKVQVRFVVPDQDYQVVDGPILDRTDLQAIDGEVLPATLSLDFTQDHRRAQRLQKAFLETNRLGRTITCSVSTSLLGVVSDELIGNAVTFSSDIFSPANGTYRVTSVGFADDYSSLMLGLVEYDASIETDFVPSVDEQDFTLATLNVS